MTGPSGRLQNRLLFHLAHKLNDENKLMIYHQKLTDDTEDQVTMHFFLKHSLTHSLKNTLTDSVSLPRTLIKTPWSSEIIFSPLTSTPL